MSSSDGSSSVGDTAPDRRLAGISDEHMAPVQPSAELTERRKAVAELGDALRDLASSAIGTEVAADVLRRVAGDARALATVLAEQQRRPDVPSSVDDLRRGQRPFNPVVGVGNAVAPPMHIEIVDGAAIGSCTLDWRYEGPFGYAHGGISALLLDQIMGYAAAAAGHPGVTGRLTVRYRATVPLGEPLRVEARFVDVLGVRSAIRSSIRLAAAPDDALVEAEGRFLALRSEQATRLFGDRSEPTS